MQIKITVRCHHVPVLKANVFKLTTSDVDKDVEKLDLTLLVGI